MNTDQIIALLNLLHTRGVGPQRVRSLVSYYRDPRVIGDLSYKELCLVEGVDTKNGPGDLRKGGKGIWLGGVGTHSEEEGGGDYVLGSYLSGFVKEDL